MTPHRRTRQRGDSLLTTLIILMRLSSDSSGAAPLSLNIMLVSVTERTREIGLRQAVGARGRDVLRQFLVEAILLSLVGGAIGVGFGPIGARTIAQMFQWPTRVSPNAILVAFGCSAVIGIFFGYYPARQAARLDPIHALRFE